MQNYGEAIKEQRIVRNLSLLDIEKATGISNQNLSRWENGQAIPGINFCDQLAQYYGISIDELIGITDEPKSERNGSLPSISGNAASFVNEFGDIIPDKNYINMSKLFKAIAPELRALILGYTVGVLQNNGVNTKKILGY